MRGSRGGQKARRAKACRQQAAVHPLPATEPTEGLENQADHSVGHQYLNAWPKDAWQAILEAFLYSGGTPLPPSNEVFPPAAVELLFSGSTADAAGHADGAKDEKGPEPRHIASPLLLQPASASAVAAPPKQKNPEKDAPMYIRL
uniref:Uncharacterized protein n=1 Tax=Strombidinopsis acuminata TaxID=141414 RepID=A0A7S3WIH2_9SPIT